MSEARDGDAAETRSTVEAADDDLGSAGSLLRDLAAAPGGKGRVLVAGDLVADQYRVERVLGEGGMGVVYLARDTRLGRNVALKLGRTVSRAGLARVAREASTLAQLSHPNVVVVHQVGDHEGRIFFAMEHVTGGTARAWVAESPRTWREIIALYAAAGDGLAAAHAVGLVHRDFKPDNVLVGGDGRARVADFGLARAIAAGGDADEDAAAAPAAAGATITRTDGIVGTPAYMPPEQLAGVDVDARADQFSYCSALWEALFGARYPATGEPPGRRVPRHVEHALRRGLRPDPAERWASMAPLLAELRRDPARRRRNLAIGATAVVAIGAAIAVPRLMASHAAAVDACAGGDDRVAAAWSPTRAADVRRAFAALHLPWTTATADAAIADLDARATRWIAADRAVCEARGAAWTDRLRERATLCLAQRRDDLAAAAAVLAAADAEVAASARAMIGALPSPSTCADPEFVAAEVSPPADPRIARAVAILQPLSSRARALILAGRPLEARRLAEALVPAAASLGYEPLIARAHGDLGQSLELVDDDAAASRELADAYYRARAVHDVRTATLAASAIVQAKLGLSRFDDAGEWARLAEVESRESADAELHFVAASAQVAVARIRKDPRARELADAHVAAGRALANPQHIAYALKQRANILRGRGEFDAAIADLEEAMRVMRVAYGDDSSALVSMGSYLSYALRQTGRLDKAADAARAALALAERLYGVDSLPTLQPAGILADDLGAAGRNEEAAAMWERVLRLDVAYRGAVSAELANDLNNAGLVLTALHRLDEATAALERSAAIYTQLNGADSAEVAISLGNLAEAQLAANRFADAEATSDRAYAILTAQHDDVSLAYVLVARGIARLGRRAFADARADLERALAIRARPDTEPALVAQTRYYLAEAYAGLGDAARARATLEPALAALRTLQDPELLPLAEALAKKLGPSR